MTNRESVCGVAARDRKKTGKNKAAMLHVAVLAVLVVCASGLVAQGAFNLSTHTLTSYNTSTSAGGCIFEIQNTGAAPLNIWRIGGIPASTGARLTTIRTRLAGGWSVYPPVSSASAIQTGWTTIGTPVSVTYSSTSVPTQIPIDINAVIQPNEILGISINFDTSSARFATALAYHTHADPNLTIRFTGGAGANNTTVGSSGCTPSSTPRAIPVQVWYDFSPYASGPHAAVVNGSVGLTTPAPVLGSNTVRATVLNIGTTALDNVPIPMQYTTDGGTTWSPTQTFTFPAFPSLGTQTVDFTATPWVILSGAFYDVRVRINPTMGSGNPMAGRTYGYGADITGMRLDPRSPHIGLPVDVKVTIVNDGNFSLEGIPVTLRYSIDGTNFVTETFTPAVGDLATLNSTKEFTFTQKATIPAAGTRTIRSDIFPQLAGDLDATDTFATPLNVFGLEDFFLNAPELTGTQTGSSTGYNYAAGKLFMTWTPEQLGYIAGEITGMSLWALSSTGDTKAFTSVKVWVGETTSVSGTSGVHYSTTILSNFNAGAPQVLAYDSALVSNAFGTLSFVLDNLKFTTPYVYSGQNSLAVLVEYEAPTTPTLTVRYISGTQHPSFKLYASGATTTTGTYNANQVHPVRIQYTPKLTGSHVRAVSAGLASNASMVVGNNSAVVTVQNVGSTDLSSSVVSLEYSLDGGNIWTPQVFPVSAFDSMQKATLVLNPAWNVAAVSHQEVQVRLTSPTPIFPGLNLARQAFSPDLDIEAVTSTPATVAYNAPFGVGFTVKNNSRWELGGHQGLFSYTLSGSTVSELLPLPATFGFGASQAFSFTQQATILTRGTTSLTVSLANPPSGDPDAQNSASLVIPDVGVSTAEWGPNTVSGSGTPIYALTTTGYETVNVTIYTPAELTALVANAEITSLKYYKTAIGGTEASNPGARLRIWLLNTTLATHTVAPTFDSVIAGATLVVDQQGFRIPHSLIGWVDMGPFNTGNSFLYTGGNLQVVTAYSMVGTTSPFHTNTISWRRGVAASRGGIGLSTVNLAGTTTLSFQLSANTHAADMRLGFIPPSVTDLDVAAISFGTNSAPSPAIGSNQIRATVRCMGTGGYTGTYGLRYSTDSGSNWTTPQTVTATGLTGINTTQDVDLTAPWNITSVGPASLMVEISPVVTGDPDVQDRLTVSYSPDLDVASVNFTAPPTLGNSAFVTATVTNNGTMGLPASFPLTLRYRVGTGAWTTQSFTASGLSAIGSSESFNFTQDVVLMQAGDVTLTVEIVNQITGDPDGLDSASRVFPATGVPTLYFTNSPPLLINSSVGSSGTGHSCELQCGPNGPITIHYLTMPASLAGTWDVNVSYRIGGGYVNYPPTVTTDLITTGWVNLGPVSMTFTAAQTTSPYAMVQIPIYLGVTLQPNEIIGISVSHTCGTWRFNSVQPTTPVFEGNADLNIRYAGYSGGRNTTPGNPMHSAAFIRGMIVGVDYSKAPPSGSHLSLSNVRVNNGNGLVVGANTIQAVFENTGLADWDNSPIVAEFSVDSGATWIGTQTFTYPSFPSRSIQFATFTAPWTITQQQAQELRVRIAPPTQVGSGTASVTRTFVPDADITAVQLNPAVPLPAVPGILKVTVVNTGGFNLTGQSLNLRYRVTLGTGTPGNWNSQSFPATDFAQGRTMVCEFTTAPVTFLTEGPYTIEVGFDPQVTGDTDQSDSMSATWSDVGLTIVKIGSPPFAPSSGGNNFPMNFTTGGMFTSYSASQLGSTAGLISKFGWQYSTVFANKTWPSVKIWMGETSNTTTTANIDFMLNFNVGPTPILVYDGPLTLTNDAADNYALIPLQTGYFYAGTNTLGVYIQITGGSSTPASTVRTYIGTPDNFRVYNNTAVGPTGTVDTTTTGAAFAFEPIYNPGLSVERTGGGRVLNGGADNLGVMFTAGTPGTVGYLLRNRSLFANLTISSVTVTNQVNCTASVSGTAPTSVAFGGAGVPLDFSVTAAPGPYSFRVSITSDTAQPGGIPYVFDVSGTGFVNTAPVFNAPSGAALGKVIFTEILRDDPNSGSWEYMEIQNIGVTPVDLSGYSIAIYDDSTSPLTGLAGSISAAGTMQPGEVKVIGESVGWWGPNNYPFPITSIQWTSSNGGAVMFDGQNNIVDAVFFGTLDYTLITQPAAIPASVWSGPNAPPLAPAVPVVRQGGADTNTSADWIAGSISMTQSNPGLSVPFASAETQVSGTHPNFIVETVVGADLSTLLLATDIDTHQQLTISVNESSTPGSISPSLAGFTTTFPASSGPGAPPRGFVLSGVAANPGTVKLTAVVSDNGVNSLNDSIDIEFRIGARLDVTSMAADSLFVRVNGRKDFYRGQSSQPVDLVISNLNPMPINLTALTFSVSEVQGAVPVTGFTFILPSNPVVIPASTANHPVTVMMNIDAQASGSDGVACELRLESGTVSNPLAPTDIFVLKVAPAAQADLFDLYNGPAPQPMAITTTALNPAVKTIGYIQNLLVSGGLGTYTWSVDATSVDQLPAGLSINPSVGTEFLPAAITGTPAESATVGSYSVTLRVTDGAYVDTRVFTITVSALTQLQFPAITLAPGMEYVPYTMTTPFTATGGSLIYTFSVDPSGTHQLPTGLILNPSTGVISGIPADGTQAQYNITFVVNDGVSSEVQILNLTINAHPLEWRGVTLPDATQTVAYSHTLDGIGGTSPRIYSIVSGSLPNGLSLNPATGLVSGVPSLVPPTVGVYNLTFRVTDALNATANQAMTLTVVPAAPLTVTVSQLPSAEVGQPYSFAIVSTGGSLNYSYSVAASGAQVPAGLTLSTNGQLTGTPSVGSDGRYALQLSVNDGFQNISHPVVLPVVVPAARDFGFSEVDTGAGYIELTNTGTDPVEVSGWSVRVWVDGNAPLSLPFDSLPGASLALPAEVVKFTIGGTAGGFWPNYSTGGSWSASAASSMAFQLLDIHGNTVDFLAIGSIGTGGLVDSSSNPVQLPADLASMPPIPSGSANYSNGTTGWVGNAAGTPGVYNPGYAPFPLTILKSDARSAASGNTYFDFAVGAGGLPPYTWSILAPAAPWLSVNPTTGVFSGTVPSVTAADTVQFDLTLTDANLSSVTSTVTIGIVPAATPASATIAVGSAEGQSFEGTVIDVPVTLTATTGVSGISGFGFMVNLPALTAGELDLVRVLPGPATIASGRNLLARDIGGNRYFVGDFDASPNPTAIQNGVIAILRFMVPEDDTVMAPEATYPVGISDLGITLDTPGVVIAAGLDGQMVLSNYKPQDVNRDDAIDVVDVQLTVNLILQITLPTYTGQGDANEDSNVDVVDVQTIVNCILLGGCN